MVFDVKASEIQTLQGKTLQLLKNFNTFIEDSHSILDQEAANQYSLKISKEVNYVKNLELRMAIVAPMKAGKSTIVNVIAGDKILPSKNFAMTTLPTEIIFCRDATKPRLILDDSIIEIFKHGMSILQAFSHTATEIVKGYPHLEAIFNKILNQEINFQNETEGTPAVLETLEFANHLVRLCYMTDPTVDLTSKLSTLPKIEVQDKAGVIAGKPGRLIIVDTPGPNEQGLDILSNLIHEQLRQSSVVVVVLDFTQIGGEAFESIKQDVKNIIQTRGSTENVYIAVNKIDQRDENGDMDPEQTRKHVVHEFDLESTDKVFEMSAKHALTAQDVLKELEEQEIHIAENLNSGKALAEVMNGKKWEKYLAEESITTVREDAKDLLNESGFVDFIEQAIGTIAQTVAPRCIKSALCFTQNHLQEISDKVNVFRQSEKETVESLQAMTLRLQEKIDLLDVKRNLWESGIKEKRAEIKDTVLGQTRVVKEKLTTILGTTKQLPRLKESGIKDLEEMTWHEIRLIDDIPATLVPIFLDRLYRQGVEKYEFERQVDFYRAERILFATITELIEILIAKAFEDTEAFCEVELGNLTDAVNGSELAAIVEEAMDELSAELELDFQLPIPKFRPAQISPFETVSNGLKVVSPNVLKKIHNTFVKLLRKRDNRKIFGDTYVLEIGAYVECANSQVNDLISEIEQELNRFIQDNFEKTLNDYMNSLTTFLSRYQEYLSDSIQSKQDSAVLREERKEELDTASEKLNDLLEENRRLLGSPSLSI